MNQTENRNKTPIKLNQNAQQQINLSPFTILQLNKQTEVSAKKLDIERAAVIELKQSKRLGQAFKKINILLKDYPNDVRCYQLKGELTFGLKLYDKSLECYDKLLEMTNVVENIQLISEINHFDDPKQRKALQIKRSQALYYYNKGLCLQKLNRHTEAVVALKWSIVLNKARIQTYISLADSYREVGNFDKMFKIYEKIIDKNPFNFQYIQRAITISKEEKNYSFQQFFIEKGLQSISKVQKRQEVREIQIRFIISKADLLKKQDKINQALEEYLKVIKLVNQQNQMIAVLTKIASCYQLVNNLDNAKEYYCKILSLSPEEIDCINNYGNLQIRKGQYINALQLFNSGILKCIAKEQRNQLKFKLILLQCHRIIVFVKLNRIDEAQRDLGEVFEALKQQNCFQMEDNKQWNNYKFVKYVVGKYEGSFCKIQNMKEIHNSIQVQTLQKQLLSSLSKEFQSKTYVINNDQIEKLTKKIDKLHFDIMNFKKTALVEHQKTQQKIHNKIVQIQGCLYKKDQQSIKLEKEMQQLKAQYSDIYRIVDDKIKSQLKNRQFSQLLIKLKNQKKNSVALYAQQFYWIFNAYLVSIRLIINNLVAKGSNKLHTTKISSFFSKFKKVFETLAHIPHVGIVCQSINALLTFYLNEQCHQIYQTLNNVLTNNYFVEQQVQLALQKGLTDLVKSNYIDEMILGSRKQKIQIEMQAHHKAQEWFKKQKNKIVGKVLQIQTEEEPQEEKIIKQLVIEDITAVLVYIVRNKNHFLGKYSETDCDLLRQAFNQTLIAGFKKDEITSLYARQTCKEIKDDNRSQGCSKCQIYCAEIEQNYFTFSLNKKGFWDELIGQSIRDNNIDLFNYAVSQIDFNFN